MPFVVDMVEKSKEREIATNKRRSQRETTTTTTTTTTKKGESKHNTKTTKDTKTPPQEKKNIDTAAGDKKIKKEVKGKDNSSPKKTTKAKEKGEEQEENENDGAEEKEAKVEEKKPIYAHPILSRVTGTNYFIHDQLQPLRGAGKLHLRIDLPDEILPGLYLGSMYDAQNKHVLKRLLNVTHILTVAPLSPLYPNVRIISCYLFSTQI